MHQSCVENTKMAANFEVGDLVWAKMKGFPAWPGKIIEPKPNVKKPANKKISHHFVFFFGSENFAWIPEDNIFRYADHKDKFTLSTRLPKSFKEAMEAIEDAVKAQPEVTAEQEKDLPSIDEELAQMFPLKPGSSPQKDYTRAPFSGKKKEPQPKPSTPKFFKNKESRRKTLDSVLKKSKETIKRKSDGFTDKGSHTKLKKIKMPSASKRLSEGRDGKVKPKIRANPNVRDSALPMHPSPSRPLTNLSNSEAADSFPTSSAGTQIEENFLGSQGAASKSVIPTPSRLGFLGLGIMGQGMVMNLLRSGHEVTVWNRTALKCKEFVKAGAIKGNNPAEVIQKCDITFSCVADSTAVKDLVFGNMGVLQGISKGKCFVEMSTIDEETMQDVGEAITARGGVFLEAPVVGSRVPALEGQLIILAAGDRKLYDDCFSCFEAIGKKSLYLGSEVGAASRMKLIVNMIMGSVVAGLAEGMAMAEKVGLDQEDVAEVLSLGALSCPTVIHKSQAILNQKYDPHFPLQHQQKDLRLALMLGDRVEQPLYVAAAANELYKKARRLGYGDSDISAVYRAASA